MVFTMNRERRKGLLPCAMTNFPILSKSVTFSKKLGELKREQDDGQKKRNIVQME